MSKAQSRPAFSFCACPDSKLLRNSIEVLLAGHPPASGAGDWQRFVFWADEGLAPPFWEHLTIQGLFAVPKALVIRNAQALAADSLKKLFAALLPLAPKAVREQPGTPSAALPSPLVWPIVCLEVAFEKGNAKVPVHIQKAAAYETALKAGWIESIPGLTPQSLPAFIKTEAASLGLALSREETAVLASALPPDAALICSELSRLALLADSEGRLPERAGSIVEHTQELSIFELMRIVQQQGPAPAAWKRILEDRLSGENLVFAFNAVLLREARILWQCLSGREPYLPPSVAGQKKAAARALGFAGIARIWELALMADKGIKSGERSPEQAFEKLAADLFMLFAGTGRRQF